jgi:1-acyl-sn-glycerol-3-phosphate acyltransferase
MNTGEESLRASAVTNGPVGMRPFYRAFWHVGQGIFRIYFRYQVFNRERVPVEGPIIIAANHESYIDPLIVGGAAPRELHFLARESALRHPLGGKLLRYFNAMPIKLDGGTAGGLRAGLEVLKAGNILTLFPEGTRTPDGTVQPFRSGVGLIAAKSAAPVLPVRIFGMHRVYGRHLRFPRPYRVVVKIGHPLTFDELRAEMATASKARLKEIYQEMADQIREAVIALRPERD